MAKGADDVIDHLNRWAFKRREGTIRMARDFAAKLEAAAKRNAPWHDQSSNARNGLFGSVRVSGGKADKTVICLGHSVEYGPFLELANDGRYAILKPTLDAALPEIYRTYERLWKDPNK